MKKLLTIILGILMLVNLITVAYCANNAKAASLSDEAESTDAEMPAVTYYRENKGSAFLYELRPPTGTEIPYGESKYPPTKCYYPLGADSGIQRPEIYTWGTGTMGIEGDYVKFTPSKSELRITFDTAPSSYYMDYAKPYLTMVLKTSKAFDGTLGIKTLDGNYRKYFPVSFTGEWQKIILDLQDPNGWEKRDENKVFYPYYRTPFCEEINKLYGGHYFYLSGTGKTAYYLFDYIMMFDTLRHAESFDGIAQVKSTCFSEAENTRTVMSAKAGTSIYFMNGYPDGTIRPNRSMTRAEAAAILARLMDTEKAIAADRQTSFTDIEKADWHYNYISYLEEYGVTSIFEGQFLPDNAITRAEFVAMAARAGAFDPARLDGTEKSVVGIAADGKHLTRAEAAALLCKILEVEEKPGKAQKYSDLDSTHWAYGIIMAVASTADYEAGKAKITEVDRLCEKRIEEIRNTPTTVVPKDGGTAYYVSNNGSDANDGKTPETAWQTLEKVSTATYRAGDAVYFRRGDTFRIDADTQPLRLTNGVSYSAYGEGDKPKIYGSPENGADPSKWTLYDAGHNIWRYERQMIDQGALILNGGESFASITQTYFTDGKFTNADGSPYDMTVNLKNDLMIFCETIPESGVPIASQTKGYLYFRCDAGNPGEVFDSIEFMPSRHMIKAQSTDYNFRDITVENLCVMYGGAHGFHATTANNFTVKNCEIGWIGGGIQSYSSTTSTGNTYGRGVRYGNAVETGYCNGYYVTNNYIYQCYDAGITFQSSNKNVLNLDIHFDNNVIESCQYSIEYWMSPTDTDMSKYYIEDYTISGNIMRNAGTGLSQSRPDKGSAAHIKGWTRYNAVKDSSYIIENNIFDRSRDMMVHIGLTSQTAASSKPVMRGNTWIQYYSNDENTASFGEYELSGTRLAYNDSIPDTFNKYGIEDTAVYFAKQ